MIARRRGPYAHVSYPWGARVDLRSPRPRAYYAALIGQTLRYGMPARRRFGPLWALAGRRGVPEGVLARAVSLSPSASDPEIDDLLRSLAESWPELAGRSRRLSPELPAMSALAIARSAGLTVFVFGERTAPLVVAKIASGGVEGRLGAETEALRAAEPAAVAPRDLGRVGTAQVQEGLAGAPLRVEPLTPARAERLEFSPEHRRLVTALERVASTTAAHAGPAGLPERVEAALAYEGLHPRARTLLAAAWRDVRTSERSALRHCDSSPQNCLFEGGQLTGIVDWELADLRGAPGFDVWNSALSYIEHGLGLVKWSEERAVEALARSWDASPFWREARAAARRVAATAGVEEARLDALELVFFGSRIGDRLLMPEVRRGTGTATSARMCELVASAA